MRGDATKSSGTRRAFVFVDAVVALGLVAVMVAGLATAKAGINHFEQTMANHRAATRLAERVLLERNAGSPTTQASTVVGITTADVESPAPPGWKWVRAEAVVNGQHGSLIGLVRSAP